MDEVLGGLLCSALRIRPNHPGGIANIQRKNNRGGLSQSGKTNVIKSDQTDWLVPIVSVKLGFFSNLQLNEPKWGTIQFNSIQFNSLFHIIKDIYISARKQENI